MQIKENVDIVGLLGFTLSGLMFVMSALRTGDTFALAGSVIWILSCLGWIVALLIGGRGTSADPYDAEYSGSEEGFPTTDQHI